MELMKRERDVLEQHLPGFDRALAARPLLEWEVPGNPGLQLFREAGGPRLLISREYGGAGLTALEAIHAQRAIASRSPSLAVATTMHHFSVASMADLDTELQGAAGPMLQLIAEQKLLMCSAFAEGKSERGIFEPTMQARRTQDGLLVNGRKKPCSLTWSMDLLSGGAAITRESGETELAVILVPAQSPGLERRKFWGNWVLAGAESDEVILEDVFVSDEQVFYLGTPDNLHPSALQGHVWFLLLASACYVGVASTLVERVLQGRKGDAADRIALLIGLEEAMAALEGMAHALMGPRQSDLFLRMLMVRYAVERTVGKVSALAAEMLGGMAFITSSEVSYLLAASRALAYHPPSRSRMIRALDEHWYGAPLQVK